MALIPNHRVAVRPARKDEVGRILELWMEFMKDPESLFLPVPTHNENTEKMRGFVAALMSEDPKQVLVAKAGRRVVGYLIFERRRKTPLELPYQFAYISDLYVEPGHRRLGVGESLLRTCLDDLRSSGTRRVRLSVWSENWKAMSLYRKAGFKELMLTLEADI